MQKRDERKDGFAKTIEAAMRERVGDQDEASQFLAKHGLNRSLVKKAVQRVSEQRQPFTIWTLVDALTQLTGEIANAGDRTEADQKVAQLLALAV